MKVAIDSNILEALIGLAQDHEVANGVTTKPTGPVAIALDALNRKMYFMTDIHTGNVEEVVTTEEVTSENIDEYGCSSEPLEVGDTILFPA